ncbi:MAG: NAD(P)/FAD-dependent oxidoreductase [Planctomycetota bacterium]
MMEIKAGVAVIGAGPCGVAAAVQLQRNRIPLILFEMRDVGGLLYNAHSVENYPGIRKGLPGPVFCRLLARHLDMAGVVVAAETITAVQAHNRGYLLQSESGNSYTADAVILATGTRPNQIDLPWKTLVCEQRLFYEVRDLPPVLKGEHVAILGAGDAAYDYALNLADRGCVVSVLQRDAARCLPLLRDRVKARERILLHEKVRITACADHGSSLEIDFESMSGEQNLRVDRLVIACGRSPEDRLLQSIVRHEQGEGKLAGPDSLAGRGIFAGGDLTRGLCRQAGIAVGDGLVAAMYAVRYVNSMKQETV